MEKTSSRPYKNLSDQTSDKHAGFNDCRGYEAISVTDLEVKTLTIPNGSSYAIITIIASSTASDPEYVAWWMEDGNDPTTGDAGAGMPIGHLGVLEPKGITNLNNFKIIGREAGKTHLVRVKYY